MTGGNLGDGIRNVYSGSLGEIRSSSFQTLSRSFDVDSSKKLSIKYVLTGQEIYLLDGEEMSLTAGHALFLKHEKSYHCNINFPTVTCGVCADLNFDQLERAQLDPLVEKEMFFFDPEFSTQRITFINPQLHAALHRVRHQSPQDDPLYFQEMMVDLTLEVLKMEKSFSEKIKSIPTKRMSYKKELFRRLIKTKNYINDHKFQKLTLKSLAKESHLSEYYLHRLFSKVFGFTPSAYLENLRLAEAAKLIKSGSTVTDVSFKVGYNDVSYFCRRFKKFYGKTPKQFQFRCKV